MRGPQAASKNRKQWDGNVYGLKLIGKGGTGFVFAIDDARAAKIPMGSDISNRAFEREHAAFRILSVGKSNQYVIKCLDLRFRDGLVLERCVKTVRECLQEQNVVGQGGIPRWEDSALMEQSLTWASQAAQGISFLHCKGIIHADVGCHNLLLDTRGNVKVADFSGSVINYPGATSPMDALVCYDVRCRRPGASKATEQTDIFALGSVIYELATGHLPYSNLRDTDVEEYFDRRAWPGDLAQVASAQPAAARTIRRCWEGEFSRAKEVATNVKSRDVEAAPACTHYVKHPTYIKDTYKGEKTGTGANFSSGRSTFNEKHWEDPPAPRKSPRPKKREMSFNRRLFSWIRGPRY